MRKIQQIRDMHVSRSSSQVTLEWPSTVLLDPGRGLRLIFLMTLTGRLISLF